MSDARRNVVIGIAGVVATVYGAYVQAGFISWPWRTTNRTTKVEATPSAFPERPPSGATPSPPATPPPACVTRKSGVILGNEGGEEAREIALIVSEVLGASVPAAPAGFFETGRFVELLRSSPSALSPAMTMPVCSVLVAGRVVERATYHRERSQRYTISLALVDAQIVWTHDKGVHVDPYRTTEFSGAGSNADVARDSAARSLAFHIRERLASGPVPTS